MCVRGGSAGVRGQGERGAREQAANGRCSPYLRHNAMYKGLPALQCLVIFCLTGTDQSIAELSTTYTPAGACVTQGSHQLQVSERIIVQWEEALLHDYGATNKSVQTLRSEVTSSVKVT
ncbi:hypothetical protein E2C01_009407 [Portunus trituberculatus]|uniref:Uncharacterized protein n=1 Tax=Portunus trituberculatus TaxID=210409 RepID=A0A5B7D4R5_PORTR|nr:hypothetical protein [Portunus trituberculatus]